MLSGSSGRRATNLPILSQFILRRVIPAFHSIDWHCFLGRAALPHASAENITSLRRTPILITGAGGSIGSGLAVRLAKAGVELILLEASETALFELQCALTKNSGLDKQRSYLGDVADRNLLAEIFRRHKPAVVIHTAAFKHVPMLEYEPLAAISNNVFGTKTVTDVAIDHGARVVLLSTDKAVAPRSVMGATKRAAEKIVLASEGVVVRLANVLGSRGSVSEVFAEQIAARRALTVTDAAAERYFLTLEEAIELLVAAAAKEDHASIVVPLLTRAHRVAELAGFMAQTLAPGCDVQIKFTGMRAGEKLWEQLWADNEDAVQDPARGIVRIAPAVNCRRSLEERLQQLFESIEARDIRSALHSLRELVPDYDPSATVLAVSRQATVIHG